MRSVIVKDFRGFHDEIVVDLAPVTVLLGENSSGKSSILAAIRIAYDIATTNRVNFNEEPFFLGAYDQIANYRAGQSGRARSFSIGSRWDVAESGNARSSRLSALQAKIKGLKGVEFSDFYDVVGEFQSGGAQPVLMKKQLRYGDLVVEEPQSTPIGPDNQKRYNIYLKENSFSGLSRWFR